MHTPHILYGHNFQLEGIFFSPNEFVNEVVIDNSVKSPPPPVGEMSENLVTIDVKDDVHTYAHDNCIYKIEAQNLKLENSQLKSENGQLKQQLTMLQKKFNDLLSGNPSEPSFKAAIKTIVKNTMEATGNFSPSQINMLFKKADGVENPRCCDWSYEDFS